jgi:hypothetical protein
LLYRKAIIFIIRYQSAIYKEPLKIRKIAGKWGVGEEDRLYLTVFCQFIEQETIISRKAAKYVKNPS